MQTTVDDCNRQTHSVACSARQPVLPRAEGAGRVTRLAPGMKRKLLIALAVAGLLSAAVGPTTLPAGAAAHVVTVKLLNGQLLTYQLPDGAPCDTSALPNVPAGAVVVGCQEVAT